MHKVIAINGNIGGGKDTVAKIISTKLNYKQLPTAGDFFRQEAAKLGVIFADFMNTVKEDETMDIKIDTMVADLLNSEDEAVMVTRVGPRFAPKVFNVFLSVDERVAAERIAADSKTNGLRKVEGNTDDIDSIIAKNRSRAASENYRYLKLYAYNQYDMSQYNKVYDTTNINADEVSQLIIKDYLDWLK